MGNVLHNKIHLGRQSMFNSARVRALMLAGAIIVPALAWYAIITFK
jgi:hypothetical protein